MLETRDSIVSRPEFQSRSWSRGFGPSLRLGLEIKRLARSWGQKFGLDFELEATVSVLRPRFWSREFWSRSWSSLWPDGVVLGLERWTCDSKCRRFEPRPFRYQVTATGKLFTHTHVPLAQSSIIWCQSRGGDALRLAGEATVGLASHWPCVTDFRGLSTYGLTAWGREIHSSWGMALLYLLLDLGLEAIVSFNITGTGWRKNQAIGQLESKGCHIFRPVV